MLVSQVSIVMSSAPTKAVVIAGTGVLGSWPSREANPERTFARASWRAAGVWGHSEPANLDPTTTFVGLHEHERWVGICEVDGGRRRIVDPGLRRGLRTPDRYARLVRGAAGRLGSGPVTLETRGDSEETLAAYLDLGFSLVEPVPGWQLNLRT